MHHLEESITEWRSRMKSAPNLGPDALDELESHLREIVEQQIRSGVPEPEAFQRAVAQLGSPPTVGSEFQKLKTPGWLPMKVAKFIIGFAMVSALYLALSFRQQGKLDLLLLVHSLVITLGHLTALLLGMLGICFVCQRSWSDFSSRRLESLCRSVRAFARLAAWLVAIGIISGMIWAKINWGAFWSWHPKEIGSLCILLWLVGFVAARRFRRITPRGLLVSSVLSVNIVIFGWFGSNLMSAGLHSYGMINYGPLCLFEILSLLFFLIGLAPAGWLRLRRKEA